jgi:hypothetical protein
MPCADRSGTNAPSVVPRIAGGHRKSLTGDMADSPMAGAGPR